MKKNIPTVELSMDTLIRECSLKNKTDEEYFYTFSYAIRKKIEEVFKYHKFHDDFSDSLTCYHDGENIIGYIRPSYHNFLTKLLSFLNMEEKESKEDDIFLTKEMLQKVLLLKSIQTETELKREFPVLYNDLMQGRKYIHDVEEEPIRTKEDKEKKDALEKYYYASGLKRGLNNFINTQVELYNRFILRRWEYKKLIETTPSMNSYIRKSFDMNKVNIYVVYQYLNACQYTNNEKKIETYLNLADKYFSSSYNKDVHVTTNEGIVINQDKLKDLYNFAKKKLQKKETIASWIILPPSKKIHEGNEKGIKKLKTTQPQLSNLKQAGKERQDFYESTDYSAKILGLEKYRGYIGYIYPNGEVLLDNVRTDVNAKGNAIYHIHAINFEELSCLDKTTLRSNKNVKRIIHTKNWEEKVEDIIRREGTEEEQTSTKQLIKRLKEKEQ